MDNEDCTKCNGSGTVVGDAEIEYVTEGHWRRVTVPVECDRCGGTGKEPE